MVDTNEALSLYLHFESETLKFLCTYKLLAIYVSFLYFFLP